MFNNGNCPPGGLFKISAPYILVIAPHLHWSWLKIQGWKKVGEDLDVLMYVRPMVREDIPSTYQDRWDDADIHEYFLCLWKDKKIFVNNMDTHVFLLL